MTRFVLAVILVVISTLAGSNVVAAAPNPSLSENEAGINTVRAPYMDFRKFGHSHADNSSHLGQQEPVPRLPELAQAFAPVATACYTRTPGPFAP